MKILQNPSVTMMLILQLLKNRYTVTGSLSMSLLMILTYFVFFTKRLVLTSVETYFFCSKKFSKPSWQHVTHSIQYFVEKKLSKQCEVRFSRSYILRVRYNVQYKQVREIQILEKLSRTPQLHDLADKLFSDDTTCTIIEEFSVHIFETVCLPSRNSS